MHSTVKSWKILAIRVHNHLPMPIQLIHQIILQELQQREKHRLLILDRTPIRCRVSKICSVYTKKFASLYQGTFQCLVGVEKLSPIEGNNFFLVQLSEGLSATTIQRCPDSLQGIVTWITWEWHGKEFWEWTQVGKFRGWYRSMVLHNAESKTVLEPEIRDQTLQTCSYASP